MTTPVLQVTCHYLNMDDDGHTIILSNFANSGATIPRAVPSRVIATSVLLAPKP